MLINQSASWRTKIIQKIAQSKKYRPLYLKTINRAVVDCEQKYGQKRAEKMARNLLHQIWGAYWPTRPDFLKLLNRLEEDTKAGKEAKETVLPILNLQSSTKERIPILDKFYQKIFSVTGHPNSIIEHACGLNPLTIFWMNLPPTTKYRAFSIDKEQVNFLKSAFKLFDIKNEVKIDLKDILVDKFNYADIVFILKLLPLLEHQQKGVSIEILEKQKCKYLVVSFPVKSLSGGKRGMADFYTQKLQELIKNKQWKVERILFDTELAFIIKK